MSQRHEAILDQWPALSVIPSLTHVFTTRLWDGGLVRHAEREDLRPTLPVRASRWVRCDQVHGDEIRVVHADSPTCLEGVDGLCTDQKDLALIISVADCCAVYLVDPVAKVIGLVHSGRKGTEMGIVSRCVQTMVSELKAVPSRMVAQLSPCIRPPHYPVDFAATIRQQLADAGLHQLHDPAICTASHPHRYFSYRLEKGQTGRMMAALAWT